MVIQRWQTVFSASCRHNDGGILFQSVCAGGH